MNSGNITLTIKKPSLIKGPKPVGLRRAIGIGPRVAPRKHGCPQGALAAFLLFLAASASAQTSQFYFDLDGNLLSQTAASGTSFQILSQPQMQIVVPGDAASFSVAVSPAQGATYQWYFNSSPIGGATADSLVVANAGSTNEGLYSVVVESGANSITSSPANLYIDSDGDGLPDSWELAHFGNLNQTATDDPDGDGVPNLQEFLDGTDPANAASALYRVNVFNDGGTVLISPNQPTFTNGQVVTLTAIATDTPFHAWTGDVLSRSNSITLTMNANHTLFAHFLPFTFIWTNPASGDWNVANNWTPRLAPGSNENVIMTVPVTVTQNSNVDLLGFSMGSPAAGPVLTGSGRVTISGTGTWLSGTMSGSGSTVVLPSATFSISNENVMTLNGRTFENMGTTLWQLSGSINTSSGIFTNDPGGVFQITNSWFVNGQGGTPRFDNSGIFEVTNGTTTMSGVQFNNYGTATISGGTIALVSGGVQTGAMTVSAGATLNLANGTFSTASNSSITGAGMLLATGGSQNFAGTVSLAGSNVFSGGAAEFSGNYVCTNNTLAISGGTASFDGTGTVSPQTVILTGGTLGGAQNVTVGGAMSWTGGLMTGTGKTIISPAATLTINGLSSLGLTSRTLDNAGTTLWPVGAALTLTGGIITNEPGALFQVQSPQSINFNGGGLRFDNAGTFRVTGGGAMTFAGTPLNNYGLVDIQGGTLFLDGGGANYGSITVPAGTTISFGNGTYTSSVGSTITGAGVLSVPGGSDTFAGTVSLAGSNIFSGGSAELSGNYICTNNAMVISAGSASFDGTGTVLPQTLILSGGTLGGAQNVTVGSAMTWTGGSMSGTGRTIISPAATLTISNTFSMAIANRTLDNAGTTLWPVGAALTLTGGIITNEPGALFQVQSPQSINFNGGGLRFDNAGTFRVTGGGAMTFGGVPLNNYGTLDLGSGAVSATGGYSCASNSILNCALGGTVPGATYGQLRASGAVSVKGLLNVYLTNFYIPKTNDSFAVLTAGSLSGAFASFTYASNNLSLSLSNAPASEIVLVTGVSLTQTNSIPAPPGIISWWRGESNALDSAGTNNGTITNGVTYAAGEVGQSFLFDGSSGAVSIPDSASLRPTSVTVEAWVKILSTNGTQLVFAKPLGTNTLDSYGLALQNGVPLAAICDNTGFGVFLSGTAVPTLGQWHHLAFTFDATTGFEALYTDGAMVASATAGKSMSFDNHPLLLGADNDNTVPDNFLNGQIDEASLYNRALTSDEVASIYNSGSDGKQAVLTVPLPFLHIEQISATHGRLYWSTNYPLYNLQYNTRLGTTNWAASGLIPVINGTNFVVTNLFTGDQKYYRLSLQPAVYIAPPPSLSIGQSFRGMIQLSWSANDDRPFVLQSNTNLMSANWSNTPASPSLIGLNYVATNSITGKQMYYRLSSH